MKKILKPVLILLGAGLLLYIFFLKDFLSSQEKDITETTTTQSLNEEQKQMLKQEPTKTPGLPEMEIDKNKQYQAILKTSVGEITLELNTQQTPITVNNFIHLARQNFYTGTVFHRVIKGFMIQGGDPKGDGTGGPGYTFADEPFSGEYERGVVAMANAGPNTNGSQFFIMHSDYQLPKNYVIFAKVTKGIETVDKIAEAPVEKNSFGEPSKPIKPVSIQAIEIMER